MSSVIALSYIQKIVEGNDLTFAEAEALMGEIFTSATDAQIGALLIALRMKGESVSEIAGFARKMRDSAVRISPRVKGVLVDIVGTGGDAANTINVSTAAAIVSAACGVPVAKHGNYAVSSKCGSANVLSELGVNISPAPEAVTAMIERLGIGFMLAPIFHPAMKRVAPVRR
ncbi:MAG: anthranilate phosphoribosyltransferase, partial [Methanothrix sp.]